MAKSHSNIYLTGFMGAGKSSTGKLLAKKLRRRFADTDQLIEQQMKLSIPQIFLKKGERSFRLAEAKTIQKLIQEKNLVVALGGGALIHSANRTKLKKSGTIIYLKASATTLEKRLRKTEPSRPLLPSESKTLRLERIRTGLKKRKRAYESAELILRTDKLTSRTTAIQLVHLLKAVEKET